MPVPNARRAHTSAKNLAQVLSSNARVLSSNALLVAVLCAALAPHVPLAAQASTGSETGTMPPAVAPARALATATRAEQPPAIDGRDDDVVWSASAPIDAFRELVEREL